MAAIFDLCKLTYQPQKLLWMPLLIPHIMLIYMVFISQFEAEFYLKFAKSEECHHNLELMQMRGLLNLIENKSFKYL